MPREGCVTGRPSPRKDSAASAMMAPATWVVATTISGERILGRICRRTMAASPAPPKVAQQIYVQATLTKMCLRFGRGEKLEDTLAWAEGECEGFMRS